jgi:hypothetical protein
MTTRIYPSCTGPCRGGRDSCDHPDRCRTDTLLPPALVWLVREIKARSKVLRWYRTNRKNGMRRRTAAWLAWRITGPINPKRGSK